MKKLENSCRFYIGWFASAIWIPFLYHKEVFGSNPIINRIIPIAIGLIIMSIGLWIANKICEK